MLESDAGVSFFILRTVQKITIILIMAMLYASSEALAQDTTAFAMPVQKRQFSPEPMKATMLAVAFPGLGQVYNRKYWKIPLVYAGFGGLVYSVNFNSNNYNKMMKAYQDFTDNIPETDSYIELITWADPSAYDPVLAPETYNPSTTSWVKDRLLSAVDYYKKYRDLSYIGIAAWYLISIIDAHVDASLFNYNINDNLDVEITPLQVPIPGGMGAGLNVRMVHTF